MSAHWVSRPCLPTNLAAHQRLQLGKGTPNQKSHAPSNLILSPISVNAWMKSAVSFDATCPLSRLSMFSPSVQSAQRDASGAIASASEPSGVRRENDRGDATSGVPGGAAPTASSGGAQLAVAISVMSARSKRSGRSSSPLRTGNLDGLST
jgi:hypothetical protein